jgi:hypothetical protein
MFSALRSVACVTALSLLSIGVVSAASAATAPVITSSQQLSSLLAAASTKSSLPSTTTPSVAGASTDFSGWGSCLLSYSGPGGLTGWPGEKACSFGDVHAKKTIVLFGDSQAWQWTNALDVIGKAHHVKMVLLARSACDLASITQWDFYSVADSKNCVSFANAAVSKIAAMHPWGVIVAFIKIPFTETLNHVILSSSQYSGYLATRLKQLVAITPRVFLMAQHPVPSQDPASCVAIHPTELLHCGVSRNAPNQAMNQPDFALAARASGANFVSQTSWYCSATYCPALVGSTLVYLDQYHFTKTFTLSLAPILGATLQHAGMLP